MTDWLHLNQITVPARIGVHDYEHHIEQALQIDIKLAIDATEIGQSDALEQTTDYVAVAECLQTLGQTHHQLIETFAAKAADLLSKTFGCTTFELTVTKLLPGTPLQSASVSIARGAVK